jgi:cytidylate kinase
MYLSVAKLDNVVIISRRAYLVLYRFINVLNVFLESPLADRVANVASERGISSHAATEIVNHDENVRIKLIEAFYDEKWYSFLPFSLVVNTHKIGLDLTEKIITEAATRLGTHKHHKEMEKVYSTLAEIETDPVLDEAISRAIQKNQ